MHNFGEYAAICCAEPLECQPNSWPVYVLLRYADPGEFVHEILKILRFGSFVAKNMLHLLRDDVGTNA